MRRRDFVTLQKARAWLGSDDMKAAMQKNGVGGSPTIGVAGVK
jgi:hypothetical protein